MAGPQWWRLCLCGPNFRTRSLGRKDVGGLLRLWSWVQGWSEGIWFYLFFLLHEKHCFPSVQFLSHYFLVRTNLLHVKGKKQPWGERFWHYFKRWRCPEHKPLWKDGLSVSSVLTPCPEKGCIIKIWGPFILWSPSPDSLFSAQG